MGEDWEFRPPKEYNISLETVEPASVVFWDSFFRFFNLGFNIKSWDLAVEQSRNQEDPGTESEKGKAQPHLMYKEGMTLKNTPYPFEDQLIEIPEGTSFTKGDKLPWVYFRREEAGRWGGSRDDVTGMMAYADGYWTVEFKRALDTKHGDDIAFKEGDEVTFACLVRSDGKTVRYSEPAVVAFAKGE
jgi:hypothetical protein